MIHMQGAGFFRGEGTYQKTARFLATQADNVGVWGALPDGTPRRPNRVDIGSGGLFVQVQHILTRYGGGASLQIRSANGTEALPTPLLTGEVAGLCSFRAYAGGFSGALAGIFGFATENHGVGALGTELRLASTLNGTDGSVYRWVVAHDGHLLGFTDNVYDIGASGGVRPRRGYFATAVQIEADGAAGVTTGLCLTGQTLGAGGAATGSFSVNVNGVRRNVLYN